MSAWRRGTGHERGQWRMEREAPGLGGTGDVGQEGGTRGGGARGRGERGYEGQGGEGTKDKWLRRYKEEGLKGV